MIYKRTPGIQKLVINVVVSPFLNGYFQVVFVFCTSLSNPESVVNRRQIILLEEAPPPSRVSSTKTPAFLLLPVFIFDVMNDGRTRMSVRSGVSRIMAASSTPVTAEPHISRLLLSPSNRAVDSNDLFKPTWTPPRKYGVPSISRDAAISPLWLLGGTDHPQVSTTFSTIFLGVQKISSCSNNVP